MGSEMCIRDRPQVGQTIGDAVDDILNAGGSAVPGIFYLLGGIGSFASVLLQVSPSTGIGGLGPAGLTTGDVISLSLNRSSGTANLSLNGAVVSSVQATGYNSTEPFYPVWSLSDSTVVPLGDTYTFDFSGLT